MDAKTEEIITEKKELINKALEKEKQLFDPVFEATMDQLEGEGCPESEESWFCPEMVETGGQLIEERVPLVLEVLYEEGYLERKVSMGIPHYRLKNKIS
ncbi:hypothetical protein KGY47_02400 [Candidatus Bipolaricaulota bacterium]|nr:hypothetical protein [Candidatus Bipolaricaulota bacterium]MBS3814692.1 hypothetical protein [Candidatus Bipolaricaulota bacterium]MBS3825839.1 hypothetical protein [Candidatus Bipolaricaulota bacterium]